MSIQKQKSNETFDAPNMIEKPAVWGIFGKRESIEYIEFGNMSSRVG
jgi:hypothetical protein